MKQGRPRKYGDHNTMRSGLMIKAGIPANSCKDKEFRPMKEMLALATRLANENPIVRERLLANLTSNSIVEQNGSINKNEATQRMKVLMGQVVGMVLQCRNPANESTTSVQTDITDDSSFNESTTGVPLGFVEMDLDITNEDVISFLQTVGWNSVTPKPSGDDDISSVTFVERQFQSFEEC
jgi:hypothetical protein